MIGGDPGLITADPSTTTVTGALVTMATTTGMRKARVSNLVTTIIREIMLIEEKCTVVVKDGTRI